MKSYNLILFFILAIFVITSEANTPEGQINDKRTIDGGDYKVWLNEVDGYDENDPVNGYAGIIGKPITSIRVSGGSKYRVHTIGSGDKDWLSEITKNNQTDPNGYAGYVNGKAIDAFAIDGDVEYAAHIMDGGWLPPVNGYDIEDFENGYAGIIGKPIDAIMIKGRTYAVSYTEKNIDNAIDKCAVQNGTCMNPSDCKGVVLNGLCPGGEDNKCCVVQTNVENQNVANNTNTQVQNENNNLNNQNSENSGSTHLNVYYIISMILAVFIMF